MQLEKLRAMITDKIGERPNAEAYLRNTAIHGPSASGRKWNGGSGARLPESCRSAWP
jgi:hypothetical protein